MQMKKLLSFLQDLLAWIPNRHCEERSFVAISSNFLRLPRSLQSLAMTMILMISGNAMALLATCNISVPTVGFGSFNAGAVRTTSVNATVTCSGLLSLLVSYTVTFSTGSANIYNPRHMVSGTHNLNYNLFKNAAFTQILGNGTSSTVTFTDSYVLGLGPVTRTYTVYARLPSQPLAFAGTYQDTITATVTQ